MDSNSANLRDRLSTIERLLRSDPERADALAGELLIEVPGHPMALLFRGIARRLGGRPIAAIEVLGPLCEREKDAPLPHLQLGLAFRESGELDAAVRAMRRAIAIRPDFSDAWLALAHLVATAGDAQALGEAYEGYIKHALSGPRLRKAVLALNEHRPADAEPLLRQQLKRHPRDVVALRLLAKIALQAGRPGDAETLLERCLELAPAYRAARHDYVDMLVRQTRPSEALQHVEFLLSDEPADVPLRKRRALILLHLLEHEKAAEVYEQLLLEQPDDASLWMSLGHCLRMLGQQEGSVDAYRRAIALAPHSGEAYWNLVNLTTHEITDDELELISGQLAKSGLEHRNRAYLHFALAKALEDRGRFAESFQNYREGNHLRRRGSTWNADQFSAYVERCRGLFTPEFFAERSGFGAEAPDPIFVVGLPRSGSTLVEQILASHPAVEGTSELPQIRLLSTSVAERFAGRAPYPDALARLTHSELSNLGTQYIERTRAYRKIGKPHFVDKTPNNFEQLGFIAVTLPRARIVDVRRHPLACGFSLFRHIFARGQHFSYDLKEIGLYYRDYLRLMEHFDAVLPGRVHRISYEALVQDTEQEIRRLLDYCGLQFHPACVRFHENPRPVATPSSEQVRSPIFQNGMEQWRHFEPWLAPLRHALAEAGDLPLAPGA